MKIKKKRILHKFHLPLSGHDDWKRKSLKVEDIMNKQKVL